MKKFLSIFIAVAMVMSFASVFAGAPTAMAAGGVTGLKSASTDTGLPTYTMGEHITGKTITDDVYVVLKGGSTVYDTYPSDASSLGTAPASFVLRTSSQSLKEGKYTVEEHLASDGSLATSELVYIKYNISDVTPASAPAVGSTNVLVSGRLYLGDTAQTNVDDGTTVVLAYENSAGTSWTVVTSGTTLNGYFNFYANFTQAAKYALFVNDDHLPDSITTGSGANAGCAIYASWTVSPCALTVTPVINPTLIYDIDVEQYLILKVTDENGDPVDGVTFTASGNLNSLSSSDVTEIDDGIYKVAVTPTGTGSGVLDVATTQCAGSYTFDIKALDKCAAPQVWIDTPYSIKATTKGHRTFCNEDVYDKVPMDWAGNVAYDTYGKFEYAESTFELHTRFLGPADDCYEKFAEDETCSYFDASGPIESIKDKEGCTSSPAQGLVVVEYPGEGENHDGMITVYQNDTNDHVTLLKVTGPGTINVTAHAQLWSACDPDKDVSATNACCVDCDDVQFTVGDEMKGCHVASIAPQKPVVGSTYSYSGDYANDPNDITVNVEEAGGMYCTCDSLKVTLIGCCDSAFLVNGVPTGIITSDMFQYDHPCGEAHLRAGYKVTFNCVTDIAVVVSGLKADTPNEWHVIMNDLKGIQVQSDELDVSIDHNGTSETSLVAGVCDTVSIPGLAAESGSSHEFCSDINRGELYLNKKLINKGNYLHLTDLINGFKSGMVTEPGTLVIRIVTDCGFREVSVPVLKPDVNVFITKSDGNTIPSDHILTAGVEEIISVTGTDPRTQEDLTPYKCDAEPYKECCGIETSSVDSETFGGHCGDTACEGIGVVAYPEDPCIDEHAVNIYVSFCKGGPCGTADPDAGYVLVDTLQLGYAKYTVTNGDAEEPDGTPIIYVDKLGNPALVTFEAVDAHNEPLVQEPFTLMTPDGVDLYEGYTGEDGTSTFVFNPMGTGLYKIWLKEELSDKLVEDSKKAALGNWWWPGWWQFVPSNVVAEFEIKLTPPPVSTTYTFNYSEGWNLVTIPLKSDTVNLGPDFSGEIYSYDNVTNSWSVPKSLVPGEAYWVKMNKAGSYDVSGFTGKSPWLANYVKGWVLVGDSFDAGMPWTDVRVLVSGQNPLSISDAVTAGIIGNIYYYDPTAGWQTVDPSADSVLSGYGYWIQVKSDTATIVFVKP